MLDDRSYMRQPALRPFWSAWLALIIANTAVYALQLVAKLAGGSFSFVWAYLPLRPDDLAHGWFWQIFTFQFLHDPSSPLHLILNCAMIWMFGRVLEERMGPATFLKLYFASGAIGGLFQCAASWIFPTHFGTNVAVVGASAGVFGLIAAFARLNWDEQITALIAFIIPVTMRAKYLLLALAVIGGLGLLDRNSGIAHAAHLGGMLAGLGYVVVFIQGDDTPWMPKIFLWKRCRKVDLAKTRPTLAPAEEFISKDVDPILDKISLHGIHSLTDREREILEDARHRMARR